MLGNEPTGSYDFLLPLQRSERGATTERVYGALREAIVRGDFEDGEELNQVALARHFGVSRVPVREALRQLERLTLEQFPVDAPVGAHQFGMRAFLDDLALFQHDQPVHGRNG